MIIAGEIGIGPFANRITAHHAITGQIYVVEITKKTYAHVKVKAHSKKEAEELAEQYVNNKHVVTHFQMSPEQSLRHQLFSRTHLLHAQLLVHASRVNE